ncbi:hypothetical protein [Pseudomonas koreensis]|uniref:hypothetical protein n=1 Tax=Pseudomonas koreensis TaxID=198620 RepID=UPI002FC9C93B
MNRAIIPCCGANRISAFGDRAEAIEKATWSGMDEYDQHGNNAYDGLIDEIARSGGVVLKLSKDRSTCSNDVTWPVAEHHRA